jgi:hypothetical protein
MVCAMNMRFTFAMALGAIMTFANIAGAAPAFADDAGTDILSAETLSITADIRAIAVDGEQSWVDGGFGKLRNGGAVNEGKFNPRLDFTEANLVWKPRLTWALSGTVVGIVQNKDRLEASLSEAFVSYKPLAKGGLRFSARAGLMWPSISLEHGGGDWSVTETITPSAINSWIGEEVKVIGIDTTLSAQFGDHKLEATAGIFDANDTAGSLLTFRGWALHDVKAVAFKKMPLPPLNAFIEYVQPRFSTPVITFSGHDTTGGYGKRPGYYAKLAWQPGSFPIRIEGFRYDNNGNPEHINANLEWGWRTRFNNVGLVADLSESTQLRAQGMSGNTKMGFPENGAIWIDTNFRSAFALVTHHMGKGSISGRIEAFGTRNHGSMQTAEDNENGWALTAAVKHSFSSNLTGLFELLHVESDRDARLREAISPKQNQTQIQAALRLNW